MSHFTPRKAKPFTHPTTATKRRPALIASAVGLALAAGIGAAALADAGSNEGGGGLGRTGELNAMGMPVVETPGSGAGTAEAAGVLVAAARCQLGQVPLTVPVGPTFTRRTTGHRPVPHRTRTPEAA